MVPEGIQHETSPLSPSKLEKVSTGIAGLDEVLRGGVPRGSMTLLAGGPGTGKTMLGMEFLVRGARQGDPGIMLTFEERDGALRRYGSGLGWNISGLEEERDALFRELKVQLEMPKQAGFYAVIVRLPGEEREQLSERYRTLKKAVLQFQGVIWSIDAYTRTMSTTFQEILYSLYPHKRGTMYEKSGRQRATGNDPLVVNKRL